MLDEIRSELETMTEAVATARIGLTRNELVDIGDIGERVKDIATKVGGLGPDDAIEISSHLTNLLAEFKSFSEEVREKLASLAKANGIPPATGEIDNSGAA
jgi:hypothetical protein